MRSVKENRFAAVTSRLLIGRVCSVFRPALASAPCPAVMYWAFGLVARYATINGLESKFFGPGAPFFALKSFSPQVAKLGSALVQSGVTSLPVPKTPFA